MPAHKYLIQFLSLAAVLLTTACSPVKTLNALIPDEGYRLNSGVPYGDLARQKLDVYVPRDGKSARPVVVFFYGGSWDSGERADYKFVAEALTATGFVVVIPDYRVYPEVLFPQFMLDPAKAASWVKSHVAQYGGDPHHIFLAGHSAGAHIAAMLTLDAEYLLTEKLKPEDFSGMIGLAGPYDFLPLKSARLRTIFGDSENQQKAQPINFVDGKNPPMLLLVGEKDGTVWPRNTYHLAAKIRAEGGPVQVIEYPNWGHIDMVAKLAKPFRGDGEMLKSIADFVHNN